MYQQNIIPLVYIGIGCKVYGELKIKTGNRSCYQQIFEKRPT